MLDPNRFQDALKRTLAASKAAEERAMESGETSELDQIETTMSRLERIGQAFQGRAQEPPIPEGSGTINEIPSDDPIRVEGPVSNTVLRGPISTIPTQEQPDIMKASHGAWLKGQGQLADQGVSIPPYTGPKFVDQNPPPSDQRDWYKQTPFVPQIKPQESSGMSENPFTGKMTRSMKDTGEAQPFTMESLSPFTGDPLAWTQVPNIKVGEQTITPTNPAPVASVETAAPAPAAASPVATTQEPDWIANALKKEISKPSENSFDQDYKQFLQTVGLESRNVPFLERLVQSLLDAGDIGLNNGRGYAARQQAQTAKNAQRLQAAGMVQTDRRSRAKTAAAGTAATGKAMADARKFGLRQQAAKAQSARRNVEGRMRFVDDRIKALEFAYGARLTDPKGLAAFNTQAAPFIAEREKLMQQRDALDKSVLETTSSDALDEAINELGLNY